MIVSGNVIAHKLLVNNSVIDDNVSCQLPSIELATSELKGAGILGAIEMPSTGQINSMTFSISQRSISKSSAELAKPGLQNIELRFVQDTFTGSNQAIPAGTKIYISGKLKKYDPGKVETSAGMEGSLDFEVLRYRQVIDGKEVLLIDKLNYIYKVNGVDYMAQIRAAL